MKKYLFLSLLLLLFAAGCKEGDFPKQFPVDSTAPKPISDPVVENMNGAVKITYKLPNETDLLYVKAVYTNTVGDILEERASVFKNFVEIRGFGKSKRQTIQLITVDRSRNESAPVPVEIEPLDSPIYEILENMHIQESWGGFKLSWTNPLKEQLIVKVYTRDNDGSWIDLETFYSTEMNASNAVRGLEPVPQTFYIFIKDIYENYTDTLETVLTPYYEIELPARTQFRELPLAPGYQVSPYSIGWYTMWDGVINVDQNMYYLGLYDPQPYITVDMGKLYILSRTRLWQRADYIFALHCLRFFEIWGTADWENARDPSNWNGWTLLGEFESYKPSGSPPGGAITDEDRAHARAGEEFEFPDDVPPIQYIRIRSIENWTKSNGMIIAEWILWGKEYE